MRTNAAQTWNDKGGLAVKFTIVGAGSSYTPELLEEMAARSESLPVKEVVLYDIDAQRLSIMEGFCRGLRKNWALPPRFVPRSTWTTRWRARTLWIPRSGGRQRAARAGREDSA
jgi:hypothetical protein